MWIGQRSSWVVAATAAAVVVASVALRSQTERAIEYQVKAAFLYNFAKFVTWPASAFPDAKSPFFFCVLGDDPFGPTLDHTLDGEVLDGRAVAIRRFQRPSNARGCHVLFIAAAQGPDFTSAIAAVDPNHVLTVGEAPRFLRDGGMINFVVEGARVRFEINTSAARHSQLRISSKLMRLARIR